MSTDKQAVREVLNKMVEKFVKKGGKIRKFNPGSYMPIDRRTATTAEKMRFRAENKRSR
jgi:hypothetical protein